MTTASAFGGSVFGRATAATIATVMSASTTRCSGENWRIGSPSFHQTGSVLIRRMRTVPMLALALAAAAALPSIAHAADPPTVIALGDSAISGEAGRWAGNTNQSSSKTDALGPSAYNDIPGAESTPGCHRSKSAEVFIGDGVQGVNLACSGARTYSRFSDGDFKPGIAFYNSGGYKGQAQALQDLAGTNKNIKAVVVLIGANDYGFADIVQSCVTDWLTSPSWWKNYCQDDADMVRMFSSANITAVTNSVRAAFNRVKLAMSHAGYTDESKYEILAQT